MLIICALTDALTTLDIPYSVALIGDSHFKCIVKPFNELHSYNALQRISDCYHVKRYRSKLPGCMDFAINSMGFPNNERINRAIFTFTDGLDENLCRTKGLSGIFKYPQLSFGFIFIKSTKLNGENLSFLEDVWNKFEKETNGRISPVKIAKIIADKNLQVTIGNQTKPSDTIKSLLELFVYVMKRSVGLRKDNLNNEKTYKSAIFKLPDGAKLDSIYIAQNYMAKKYNSVKGLFVQGSDVLKNATSVIDQLDTSQFSNQLNRITTCNIDNSLKRNYPLFFKEYILTGNSINRSLLETVFKPNKASLTVLSSTGIDFDITALILNLINPVPDPMIYLEEKGGLIRNYGITVVIDASYSCFNPLSASHSFHTIRSVLSSLASVDLPCFDLIIATKTNPIVLCSQVKTLYALNNSSMGFFILPFTKYYSCIYT